MKIIGDGIFFDNLDELIDFAGDFKILQALQLANPIKDNSGNILVKESVALKQSMIDKLRSLDGGYVADFKVQITTELTRQLSHALADKILTRLKAKENEFLIHIFDSIERPYRGFISTALRQKKVLLTLFKISQEKPLFFRHICDLGLLSLGIALQGDPRIRNLRRNAFLAGLLSDMHFLGSDQWQLPVESNQIARSIASQAAGFADRFGVPEEVVQAIRDYPVETLPGNSKHPDEIAPFPALSTDKAEQLIGEILSGQSDDTPEEEQAEESNSATNNRSLIHESQAQVNQQTLSETLKIAHYVDSISRRIESKEHFAEELVYMMAYNSSRGHFDEKVSLPILKLFREYELNARRLMRIAEIEGRCLHPASAWAYPKPRATQMLCRNHHNDCRYIVQGWDIRVITAQEAFGWIGASLPADSYAKCHLEEDLANLESWSNTSADENS